MRLPFYNALTILLVFLVAATVIAQTKNQREPVAFYSGQVVDSDGSPIGGATVFGVYASSIAIGEPRKVDSVVTTESDGKFRLPLFVKSSYNVCAWSEGRAIGLKRFNARRKATSSSANIFELAKPKTVVVSVIGADGSPAEIESARLHFTTINERSCNFAPFAELPIPIPFKDDQFTVAWLPENASATVEVSCKDHETFSITIDKDSKPQRKATLLPVAYVEGLITTKSDPIGSCLVIGSASKTPVDESHCRVSRRVNMKAAEDGTYRMALAEGTASISCFDSRTGRPNSERAKIELSANQTAQYDFQFPGLVSVFGRVVDEDGNGIQGVKLANRENTITDMNGGYEFEVVPDSRLSVRVAEIPEGYTEPIRQYAHRTTPPQGEPSDPNMVMPVSGEDRHEVADIVLKSGSPVKGTVVDLDGKPVEGASVMTGWQIRNGRSIHLSGKLTSSDAAGNFVVGNAPSEDVSIYAYVNDMATQKVSIVEKSNDRNVRLVLSPDGMMKLKGKISSTNGAPISNANIVVLRREGWSSGDNGSYGSAMGECKTQEDGSFEFPIPLLRCEYYTCKVTAPGFVGKDVRSLKIPESGNPNELADFRLSPLRSIRGTVVDSKGTPIPKVRVWSHHFVEARRIPFNQKQVSHRNHEGSSVDTDADGKFELTGLHDKASFVFADKAGYRMSGTPIGEGANEIRFELESDSENKDKLELATLSQEQRRIAVNQLVDFVTKAGKTPSRYDQSQMLEALLLIDRDRLRSLLEEMEWEYGKAQFHAASGHHDEALETSLAFDKPLFRFQALTACAARTEDAEHRATLLAEAAFQLSNIPDVNKQISMSSSLIDELLDVGETETATELARSIQPAVEALAGKDPRTEFTKAWFAKSLVRIDYDAAWELIKETRDTDILSSSGGFMRHAGNMAHELAAEDPDRAIELLNKIRPNRRGRYLPRVACRMASVDSEKAIKLIDSWDETFSHAKANGLASMAWVLKESNPKASARILDQSFESLFGKFPQSDHRIGMILNLLRHESHLTGGTDNFWKVVERLSDPNMAVQNSRNNDKQFVRQSELALLLTLFGRLPKASTMLCDSLAQRFETAKEGDPIFRRNRKNAIAIAALAIHDPERAVEMAKTIHEKTPAQFRNGIPKLWAVAAGCLAREGGARIDYMADEFLFTWILGEED
jgi:protocatechuate 3,4-dioxygenase beta subunit